jgi:hypothetical protein
MWIHVRSGFTVQGAEFKVRFRVESAFSVPQFLANATSARITM